MRGRAIEVPAWLTLALLMACARLQGQINRRQAPWDWPGRDGGRVRRFRLTRPTPGNCKISGETRITRVLDLGSGEFWR